MVEAQTPVVTDPEADVVDDSSPKELDQATINAMHVAMNHWHSHGQPEKAKVLNECLAQNRTPPSNLVYFGDVRPETGVDPSKVKIPARYGAEASQKNWAAFAKQTTDMEPEILEKMTRRDIVSMLEVKGVIPVEERKDTGKPKAKPKS